MTLTLTRSAQDVFAPTTALGAARGADMAEAQLWGTEVEAGFDDIYGLFAHITTNGSPNYATTLGNGARPTPAYDAGAALLTGFGTTAIGAGVLSSAANNATFSTFTGYNAGGNGANNLYCVDAYGMRSQYQMADGQYVHSFGVDSLFTATYGRNTATLGAKAFLWAVDVRDSLAIGVGAGYGAWKSSRNVIIGNNACDAGQPASAAAAATLAQQGADNVVVGIQAGRFLRGSYNAFLGNNAASITTITGSFNIGVGRSTFGALTSGIGNVAIGDGAGGVISTGNYNVNIGFQTSPGTGTWSNTSAIGYQSGAALTGDNQVQLGGAGTTPYAYASLSIRSDERDKTDIGSIDLDIAQKIVLDAEWATYRVDPREAYIDTVEVEREVITYRDEDRPTGFLDARGMPIVRTERIEVRETVPAFEAVHREKDGSRAGKRRHAGIIAQREHARLSELGIDFAGLKHGAHEADGRDVWSAQYEQYVPYMGVILADHATKMSAMARENAQLRDLVASLASRLDKIEGKKARP